MALCVLVEVPIKLMPEASQQKWKAATFQSTNQHLCYIVASLLVHWENGASLLTHIFSLSELFSAI